MTDLLPPSREMPFSRLHAAQRQLEGVASGRVRTWRWRIGQRAAACVGVGILIAGGAAAAAAAYLPSPKAQLTHRLNSVVATYGRAVATRTSQEDCASTGMTYATGYLNGTSTPTLLATFTSSVAALDKWFFNQAVPTVPATNALEIRTMFDAITTGTAPTSVCYFLGPYGQVLSTPVNPESADAQGVLVVFITAGRPYWAGTIAYPMPEVYQTPPAA